MMIDKYLEKEIFRKMELIKVLWSADQKTSSELGIILGVTSTTIKNDVKLINLYYGELSNPIIISETTGYSILNKKTRDKRKIFQSIYNDSLFIRACCFMLKENFKKIEKFAEVEFISISKSYELKKKVIRFLKELNIRVSEKYLVNNECRWRFLITYFQMKVGISVVSVSDINKFNFKNLFKEIETIENCRFSDYSKEYASILFQLNYSRRKEFPVIFDNSSLEILKKSPIYKRLREPIYDFLSNKVYTVPEEEILFFALVINIMNANYIEEGANFEKYQSYVELIQNSTKLKYQYLIERFQYYLGNNIHNEIIFEASLIFFLRKCIFDLQVLIPEEHVEIGSEVLIPGQLKNTIKLILSEWVESLNFKLTFSEDHIQYFASKIYFILKRKEKVKKIYILTSFFTDYLLAKEILQKEYGSLVEITQFKEDAAKKIKFDDDALIIYDIEYSFIKDINCNKLQILFVFDLKELSEIRKHLYQYDLDGISRKDN